MSNEQVIAAFHQEMGWLQKVIDQAFATYFLQEGHEQRWQDIPPPDFDGVDCPYSQMVQTWGLNTYQRLALALALAPHWMPEVLDVFLGKNQVYDRAYTEFGGVLDKQHSGFLPTGQTFSFIASVGNPEGRFDAMAVLDKSNVLIKEQVIKLETTESYLPRLNGLLTFSPRWYHYFMTGFQDEEQNNASFPATRISTQLDWGDVVLDPGVLSQVEEIRTWMEHGQLLMEDWGLVKRLKPGYRALFYGPPGTGKTLTASLLGKASGKAVYRIDLSMIVSKYIGETEKNLAGIFDLAEHRDWILFFDEADALFGKRTVANSSNDRHANQQTAYLLQRIEDFPGVVILASNLKANIDEAFTRRFQSIIYFPMPSVRQRHQLWTSAFSGKCSLASDIDLDRLSEEYELAGGSIINVLRHCALAAVRRGDSVVRKEELMAGLKKEFKKENRTIQMGA